MGAQDQMITRGQDKYGSFETNRGEDGEGNYT